ncbi:hypothetical protein E2562_006034 [Oryza meyeriana var. granulata]|uniref:Uncharacterized protein n=1 Tax=Oryza meyeriana var. granulata TaxID=110450 RepID=A0A6G1EVE7_9ORYZ|nr:hypothetical protein E2562_006034 [Oryza meyeriana var. granulata]
MVIAAPCRRAAYTAVELPPSSSRPDRCKELLPPSSCLHRHRRRRRFRSDEPKARSGEPETGYGKLGGDAPTRMGGGGPRRRGQRRPDKDG